MFELQKNEDLERLIAITKSDSGIMGPELAKAHLELGKALGSQMTGFDPQDTTVVAVLRGGIFFAEGIYFSLGCKFEVYDPKRGDYKRPDTKNVILVDSVINTGKTLVDLMTPDTYVACCVISEKAMPVFKDKLFTVRVSKNSFVGSNVRKQQGNVGPDTTSRLFNQL